MCFSFRSYERKSNTMERISNSIIRLTPNEVYMLQLALSVYIESKKGKRGYELSVANNIRIANELDELAMSPYARQHEDEHIFELRLVKR